MSEYSMLVRTAGLQSVENVCSNDVDLQLTETHTLDIFIKHQVSVPPSHITIRCYCLAVLHPSVGHTIDVLSPFIPVLCHSD